ncbi:hypothetical protein FRB94_003189 [Tulasnella sp. JGI-2019a]|nr:hypothetical protein FRB94_003189 [Tulasnella sp. JGI-2019a]
MAPWQALDLEEKEAPNLEALVLTCLEQSGQPTFEINLSKMFAPNLRELTLGSIYLRDWASETLHGLRLLSLTGIRHGLSMQTLLDALRECSGLTTLKLDGVDFECDIEDTTAVHLPDLRVLHVEGLEGEAVEILLESIQAPSVIDFSISYDAINTPYGLNPRVPSRSTTTAPSLAKWFDLCVGSTRFLHIRVSETLLRFEMARERQTDITSKFFMGHPFHTSHILNWAAPRLDTSLPLTLTLTLRVRRYLLSMLERLAPLTRIVELWVYDYGKALHTVLNALATPRTLPNGARAWLWPKLETIIIESMRSSLARDVLRMLQGRFGAVASDSAGMSLDAPVQLKELSLTLKPDRRGLRMNVQTLSKIRKLLGTPETCAIRWQGTLLEDYPMGTGALQDNEGAGWDFKRTQRRSSSAD